MWEARTTGVKQLEVLGDPNHGRDFLFSDDLASALYFLEEHYFESTPINIGPGTMTSIGDLVRILSELMDYPGEIQWNTTQVSATAQRVLDNSKIRELGFSNFVELRLGLSQVLGWLEREFQSNFKNIRWNE
jgi:GDP-L-fucose synthase